MAVVRARMKPLVWRQMRMLEQAWREQHGPYELMPPHPRHMYRVLCGHTFPATGSDTPCPQVLGLAVPGALSERIVLTQMAVELAEGRAPPTLDDWFLTGYRAHLRREPDGTYSPRPTRRSAAPGSGRRRSLAPQVTPMATGHRPIGRRPLPPKLRSYLDMVGYPLDIDGEHTVVGHSPTLPCVVRCPRCNVACDGAPDGRPLWHAIVREVAYRRRCQQLVADLPPWQEEGEPPE